MAFLAPFFWALIAVIDNYFVSGVYEDELDGTLISAFSQIFIWILVPLGVIPFNSPGVASFWAFSGGTLLIVSFYFYFKSLFILNDSVFMQLLYSLSIIMTPFLAFIIIGERLKFANYIGLLLAFFGILSFQWTKKKIVKESLTKILPTMIGAIFFLSLSMTLSKKAFEMNNDFWSIYLLFSLGATCMLPILFIMKKGIGVRVKRLINLNKKYLLVFVLSETLAVLATLAAEKAISMAPAVSFIAVIGTLIPVFILLITSFLLLFFRAVLSEKTLTMYKGQLVGFKEKSVSFVLIAIGIYVMTS